MSASAPLPIDDALGPLRAALGAHANAVLVAPPGAGKTTRAPLALLDEPWAKGKRLLLIEPRRLAARAAASRMAATLGEKVGETIGLKVRLQSLVSKRTRIEVVTEGVFTRQILDDPVARGCRGCPVRRVPRALARRRPRPCARARRAAGPARGPSAFGHVGDARRRARALRCSATRRSSKAKAAPIRSQRAMSDGTQARASRTRSRA